MHLKQYYDYYFFFIVIPMMSFLFQLITNDKEISTYVNVKILYLFYADDDNPSPFNAGDTSTIKWTTKV
jgi:hypothetical protein